jgi:hypothetical protein
MKLKNLSTFILIMAFFGLSATLAGQVRYTTIERVPAFGIKGGINFSDITDDNDPGDINARTGFHVGLFFETPIAERLSFRPEVLYSTKGTELTYNTDFFGINIAEGESTFNLNYIDVPLYLVYYLTDNFNIHVGPYVGFLLNANVTTDTEILNFIEIDGGESLDRDHFNNTEFGVSAGLGFVFGNLSLGANYVMGLNQVADSNAAEVLLGESRNKVLQVSLGLRF